MAGKIAAEIQYGRPLAAAAAIPLAELRAATSVLERAREGIAPAPRRG